jgi:kynurenine formamidase
MQAYFNFGEKNYALNWDTFYDLSLPLNEGTNNPNCYYAEEPKFEVIRFGPSFVGSVREGGSCNYKRVSLTPHGNGTHTECYGHISSDNFTVNDAFKKHHFSALLISVLPKKSKKNDSMPYFEENDFLITLDDIMQTEQFPTTDALIVRTLPNLESKKTANYSGKNPPYFAPEIGTYLRKRGIMHFLCDLPSVDRESDGGLLSFHKNFWNYPDAVRKEASITELIFVPNEAPDGLYLLNIQTPPLQIDAVPSRPVIYPMREFINRC